MYLLLTIVTATQRVRTQHDAMRNGVHSLRIIRRPGFPSHFICKHFAGGLIRFFCKRAQVFFGCYISPFSIFVSGKKLKISIEIYDCYSSTSHSENEPSSSPTASSATPTASVSGIPGVIWSRTHDTAPNGDCRDKSVTHCRCTHHHDIILLSSDRQKFLCNVSTIHGNCITGTNVLFLCTSITRSVILCYFIGAVKSRQWR
jgi:hypothetical protein